MAKHKLNYIKFNHGASDYMIEHLVREDGSQNIAVYKGEACPRFKIKYKFAFVLEANDKQTTTGILISDAIRFLNKQRPAKLLLQKSA